MSSVVLSDDFVSVLGRYCAAPTDRSSALRFAFVPALVAGHRWCSNSLTLSWLW
jgi:hypothetical protein